MIDIDTYNRVREKHGDYASWAVWAEAADKPKSNMSDMSIFDPVTNPRLLETLRSNVIMVGLNFSRLERNKAPWGNFHDPHRAANDFKIRYAFQGTDYYGAYMTDIIKNLVMLDSKEAVSHLEQHPDLLQENISSFRAELRDLGCHRPLILAFGRDTFQLIRKNLDPIEYLQLVKLTHYSHQIGKEKCREDVLAKIAESLPSAS